MNSTTETQKKQYGAFPLKKGAGFRVWAPHAKSVKVTGDFCKWKEDKNEMESEGDGNWYVEIPKIKAGAKYKYLIETQEGDVLKKNDPCAVQLENSEGASIFYVDNFDWEEDSFEIEDWNKLVIYEMHIGTFHAKGKGKNKVGNFKSAMEKLPELKELGINAIEILPVNEFAGESSWGYNLAYPYAIEDAYGTPDDFKNFIKEAHRCGIAVILDVVYNHLGPQEMDMWRFDGWHENDLGGIYFYNDWRAETPWGHTRLDYGREEVRNYLVRNAMMWLEDFRCDGLRLDAVGFIRNVNGKRHEGDALNDGYELMRQITQAANERFPKKIIIAEDTDGDNFVTDHRIHGGLGFSARWDLTFMSMVRRTIEEPKDEHRNLNIVTYSILGNSSGDPFKRIIYTESHDEVANGKQRITEEVKSEDTVDNYFSKKLSSLGAIVTLTSGGIPMIFQGQELLEDKWFNTTNPLDWSKRKKFSGIYNMYRDLIKLRKNVDGKTKGLNGSNTEIAHLNNENKVMGYVRWFNSIEEDGVMVLLNFSNQSFADYHFVAPCSGNWKLVFNSDWEGYSEEFGAFETVDVHHQDGGNLCVALPPYAGLIFVKD